MQTVARCLDVEVARLEKEVLRQLRPDPLFGLLKSVSEVGNLLAPTIRLETGRSVGSWMPATMSHTAGA